MPYYTFQRGDWSPQNPDGLTARLRNFINGLKTTTVKDNNLNGAIDQLIGQYLKNQPQDARSCNLIYWTLNKYLPVDVKLRDPNIKELSPAAQDKLNFESMFKQLVEETDSLQLIRGLSSDDWPQIRQILEAAFPEYIDWVADWVQERTNDALSLKIVNEGRIIGVYNLRADYLASALKDCDKVSPNASKYDGILGLEGIAIGILPEFRKQGLGKKLIDESYKIARLQGYPYIFGQQMKSLDNLEIWLKRRKLMGSNDELYVTLVDL